MTERLEAWLEGAYAGAFEFEANEPVTFTYERVGHHNNTAWNVLDEDQARALREIIGRNVDVALGNPAEYDHVYHR